MDIFIPKQKIWTPDSKRILNLMPHRVMMGAGGSSGNDQTSYAFDGVGDYLSSPDHANWQLGGGTGNFTIDFWARFTALSGLDRIINHWEGGTNHWSFYRTSVLYFRVNSSGASIVELVSAAWTPTLNQWYHIAAVRGWGGNANDWAITIDGTQSGATYTLSETIPDFAGSLLVGMGVAPDDDPFQGQLDEIRISNMARWTSNFTPAINAYGSDANTHLLIHCGETKTGTTGSGATFTDSGATGHVLTENGNAIEDTTNYKF